MTPYRTSRAQVTLARAASTDAIVSAVLRGVILRLAWRAAKRLWSQPARWTPVGARLQIRRGNGYGFVWRLSWFERAWLFMESLMLTVERIMFKRYRR